MQKIVVGVVGIAFVLMLAACGGGGGSQPPVSAAPNFYQMRYMHAGGIPYDNGPEPQAQGVTDSNGTFTFEQYSSNAECYDSSGHNYYCQDSNLSMSLCGNALPKVAKTTASSLAFNVPTAQGKVSYQLPPGYRNDYGVFTWLPTDTATGVDFATTMRIANNLVRIFMMGSTTTDLSDGLQLSSAVATGTCQPFSYSSTDLETDTASMQSIAPNPLPSVDTANTYLKELLSCRLAGAWRGGDSVSGVGQYSSQVTGDTSLVFGVAGDLTGYLGFETNPTAPYTGSLSFSGSLSLASDQINYTVPEGSGALSYTQISMDNVITDQPGYFYFTFLGPDGLNGAARASKVGMYYFNAVKKYVKTIQGASKQWVLEVDDDGAGNIGGYIADAPHYKTVIVLSGTKQGDTITFHSFDWNQGRPTCGSSDTSGCLSSGTDTGPSVAPPTVDGSLTVDSTGTTATGTLSMPSDSVNVAFTTAAPLPGCYL